MEAVLRIYRSTKTSSRFYVSLDCEKPLQMVREKTGMSFTVTGTATTIFIKSTGAVSLWGALFCLLKCGSCFIRTMLSVIRTWMNFEAAFVFFIGIGQKKCACHLY